MTSEATKSLHGVVVRLDDRNKVLEAENTSLRSTLEELVETHPWKYKADKALSRQAGLPARTSSIAIASATLLAARKLLKETE